MAETIYKLGDIVALTSHPYTFSQTNILIGGDPQTVSPLMVIIDTVVDSSNLYDENIGMNLHKKGESAQYKCLWYSTKAHQFEEAWLSSSLLKRVVDPKKIHSIDKQSFIDEKVKHGSMVTLKTALLESYKKKSNSVIEGLNEKKSITPLLSFVSPIMHVIGTHKNEAKGNVFDSKTGKKHTFSELMVKCKWFNPISDKMSEKLLPIESLSLVSPINDQKLDTIQNYIDKKLNIEASYEEFTTILKFQKLKFIHGHYIVICFDHIKNKTIEIDISDLEIHDEKNNLVKYKYPDYKEHSISFSMQFLSAINIAIKSKNYVRIKYKDRLGNVTIRTVGQLLICPFLEDEKEKYFLIGHCELRGSERRFHLDRLIHLEILDFKYEN